ncbi:Hypothetical predicted protein [Lecanosticta acicola]|uniref:Uncharacterized protein n=1 Tax=Lecanosticta acicola TaxID=111012 RepID=A0AAI9EBC7_9PEZI|nr:Hypothetical predicted protein [Lecanosticta acicola]
MPSSSSQPWPVKQYTPRHQTWPYNPSDFTRQDSTPDAAFYSVPRFVTHIDDAAIATLAAYYDAVLPKKGKILDFCSSWVSHYPPSLEQAAARGEVQITGMGMVQAELDANEVLNHGRLLQDLNEDADLHAALVRHGCLPTTDDSPDSGKLDASTNVVSTDYLTQPVAVLRSLRKATKPGGTVHLIVSNRCFPTKAISRWLRASEGERLEMVGDFLFFAGWKKIEIVELSNGMTETEEGSGASGAAQGGFQGLMGMLGMMNRRDPLWAVRAVKE